MEDQRDFEEEAASERVLGEARDEAYAVDEGYVQFCDYALNQGYAFAVAQMGYEGWPSADITRWRTRWENETKSR